MSTTSASDYAAGYSKALRNVIPPFEKLREYASRLPPIYRDVLTAIPQVGPERTAGEPVAFATLQNYLSNQGATHTEAELVAAIDNLIRAGLLSEPEFMTNFAPTPLGEALIEVVTSKRARPVSIPDLPAPTW